MKTNDLIDALARNSEAPKTRVWPRLAFALIVGLLIAVGLVLTFFGMRPDIGAARMMVMMKAGFAALGAGVVLPLLLQLAKPGRGPGWRLAAIGGFALLCAGVVAVALMGGDPSTRFEAWMGGAFPWCIVLIPVLATPTAALLGWLVRDLAPTRLAMTGAALGAVSGGVGAMAYAMYCPTDSAAFVATWYAVAIALCAVIGAVVGARLLRW
ncbi:MAG: DUF1109 domain-containing protein [Alphaproteobacteria bacterium]|nr:DUF1109 domain-containing protein [Alphaproteobacteria bacterium]